MTTDREIWAAHTPALVTLCMCTVGFMTTHEYAIIYMNSVLGGLLVVSPIVALLLFKARLGLESACIIAGIFFTLGVCCWMFGYGAMQALDVNPRPEKTIIVCIFALLIFIVTQFAIDKILGVYEGKPFFEAAPEYDDHDVDDHF